MKNNKKIELVRAFCNMRKAKNEDIIDFSIEDIDFSNEDFLMDLVSEIDYAETFILNLEDIISYIKNIKEVKDFNINLLTDYSEED